VPRLKVHRARPLPSPYHNEKVPRGLLLVWIKKCLKEFVGYK